MTQQPASPKWSELPEPIRDCLPSPSYGENPILPSGRAVSDVMRAANELLPALHDGMLGVLHPIDIVVLMAEAVAGAHFWHHWSTIEGMSPEFVPEVTPAAVQIVVLANTAYAMYAGLVSPVILQDESDYPAVLQERIGRWWKDVRQPAIQGRDNSPRAAAIRTCCLEVFQFSWNPDVDESHHRLERVMVDHVGGNEWDARDREGVAWPVLAGLNELLSTHGVRPLWHVENGRLVANEEVARHGLNTLIPAGRQRDVNVWSLERASDRPMDVHRELLALLRELREARDVAEQERYPLLQEALEKLLQVRTHPDLESFVHEARRLVVEMRSRPPELRAALVYLYLRSGVSLREAASAYGVSLGLIRGALPEAERILKRLRAA